ARPRLSRIYYNGQFFSYPLKAFEALLKLGVFASAACMLSYAYAKTFPVTPARTFHEWVRNQFGERLFQIFFKTYTEKVWGMSCDEISADWAAQRIKGLDLWSAMANALRRSMRPQGGGVDSGDGEVIKTLIESFRYPRKGPGMMWETAARRVKERGGMIHMGHALERLRYDRTSQRWTATTRRGDGSRATFTAAHVISSAPIRELCRAL